MEQYKVAKRNAEAAEADIGRRAYLQRMHEAVLLKPESERTPGDKAIIKAVANKKYHNRPRYDYEDEWDEQDDEDEDTQF